MRINVKSQILNGYNFQNNGFCKKIQTVLKSALKNTSLKKKFEIREGRGKVHFSQIGVNTNKYMVYKCIMYVKYIKINNIIYYFKYFV